VEPTEAQYLIINALETLDLLIASRYDEDTGIWYINTLSPVLPFAMVWQSGDITPVEPVSEQ
jgi:hypothetical protein